MDDQGAGGSTRGDGTNSEPSRIRESSLPLTLLPHLVRGPQGASPQNTASLMDPNWPSQSSRSRSQDGSPFLPSPSHLLRQTESAFDYGPVILSRSLNASPVRVGPIFEGGPNSSPPVVVLPRPLPPVDDDEPPNPTMDRSMVGHSYLPMTRSMSTSPLESHSRSYSHVPPYGRQPASRTPQPPQHPSRQAVTSPGIQDVLMEDVGVLPQPEVPVRPPRDPYTELRHSPGFTQEQRRGRTDVRGTRTSRGQRTQVQTQDHRMTFEQGRTEGFLRDPQRQTEPFSSQSIRGTLQIFPLISAFSLQCPVCGIYRIRSCEFPDPIFS